MDAAGPAILALPAAWAAPKARKTQAFRRVGNRLGNPVDTAIKHSYHFGDCQDKTMRRPRRMRSVNGGNGVVQNCRNVRVRGTFDMNSAARFLGVATACATLLIAGAAVEPAKAQGQCKDDVVTASGRAKFRPFTKTKELEGRGSAMADAVVNWQKEVREKYGDQWNSWSRAKRHQFRMRAHQDRKDHRQQLHRLHDQWPAVLIWRFFKRPGGGRARKGQGSGPR